MLTRITVFTTLFVLLAVDFPPSNAQTTTKNAWRDRSPHKESFVNANGVRLHYLDWGGRGEPIVFLTGLGVSAHIFDDLAPQFTSKHRVLSYTRRGLGKSERTADGYDTATLTEDLRAFLDALKIERATLVGWSLAGTEMTRLAERYPERINRLVYLESAYDYADLPELWGRDPIVVNPSEAEMRTWEASKKWFRKVYGFWSPAVEADGRAVNLQPDGTVKLQAMPPEITGKLIEEMTKANPNFAKIKVPVLAFYAMSANHPFANSAADAVMRAKGNDYWTKEFTAFQLKQMDTFKKAVPQAKMIVLKESQHLCFVKKTDEATIVAEMNRFLKKK